jgi:OTT_1508-like deaminase
MLIFLLELTREICAQQIFEKVMILSRTRIHSRLQSVQWKKPAYFRSDPEPLHQGLKKFSHWLKQQHPKSHSEGAILVQQLDNLCSVCQRIDGIQGDTAEELQHLKDIVRKSYDVCTSNGNCTIENTISAHGFDPKHVCDNKYIRQVDKIGRYWGSCRLMAEASRKYKEIFMNMGLQVIPPYGELKSPISFKGGIVSCHVHAEIQLLVFYGLNPNLSTSIPRILGVSKSACYLCDLFIQKHGQFFITKTHGRLHDQWTVPDLAEFLPNQLSEYQRILSEMYKEFELEITKAWFNQPRKYPQGSWLSLPTVLPMSLATSNAGTTVSETSGHRTMTPRIPSVAHTPRQNSPLLRNIITRNEQLTEIAVSNVNNDASSPSSEVSTRPKFPIHRKIAEDAPFHVTSGKLSLEVGLEGVGQHEITIDNAKDNQRTGDIINVGEMIPGKEMKIERNNPENRIVLTLRYGTHTSLQLIL